MIWVLLIIVLSLFVYLKIHKLYGFWKKKNIPYLKPWPLVGNMSPFLFRQMPLYKLIEQFYKTNNARYVGFYNFIQPLLLIKDIELAKQMCIKDFDHFVDHKSFFSESREPVFSENLFSAKGQKWRELRATISPVFTGSKMRSMFTLISECADRFTNHFLRTVNDEPLEVDMKVISNRFTIDVLATTTCGIEVNSAEDDTNEFYKIAKKVSNFEGRRSIVAIGYMIMPSVMRYFNISYFTKKQIKFFENIVSTTIAHREKHGIIRPDLLHIMMQARKGQLKHEDSVKDADTGFAIIEESEIGKNSNVKLDITDDIIVAQVMTFFIGGVDTTSTFFSFVSYELAVNIDIQTKLQNEIDAAYIACDGNITYESVMKLKYLDMVICETMRKWPQAYIFDRLCEKDYIVKAKEPGEKDFVIEKGMICWFPVIGYHTDPKYYADPDRFDPERFNDENKRNINPYAYMPFGQGPRSCIGNRFALLIIKTFLFVFLHRFTFVVTKKTNVPLKISKFQILLNSADGFWIGFQKRVPSK